MKQLNFIKMMLISALLNFEFGPVSAQLNVDSLGRVGIGTNPQYYQLEVYGDTRIDGNIWMQDASNAFFTNNPIVFNIGGTSAGFTGSSGYTNVSFGYGALSNPYTGSSNNVAVGFNTLSSNTTGYSNTASGIEALLATSAGSCNTGIGRRALYYNTTGSYNTAIGDYANVYSSNQNNSTALGRGATATASDQVKIGNSSVTSIGGYTNWSNVSDERIKKNIRTNVPGLAFINRLQPVTYNLDLDAVDELLKIDKTEKNDEDISQALQEIDRKSREAKQKRVQTGFVAQDVERTAKDIGYDFSAVDVDELGIYGLRYAEFVVPLVKAVQELSEQNERLQEQINELKGTGSLRSVTEETEIMATVDPVISLCKLYQNAPNPFSERTTIRYSLTETVKIADIYIFNMQGSIVKKIVADRSGKVEIQGSDLQAGMYLYSLVADGKEVDTKRMILTK